MEDDGGEEGEGVGEEGVEALRWREIERETRGMRWRGKRGDLDDPFYDLERGRARASRGGGGAAWFAFPSE